MKQLLKVCGMLVLYLCISRQISKPERFFLVILEAGKSQTSENMYDEICQ